MKNFRINMQTLVGAIFIAIFMLAALTTVFGQNKPDKPKKQRTKVIQLKVTEDENGQVQSVDTTFVFEGDEWKGSHQFGNHYLDMKELKLDSLMQQVTVWTDKDFSSRIEKLDSIMVHMNVHGITGDSLQKSIYIFDKSAHSLDSLQDVFRSFEYKYAFDTDSLQKAIQSQFNFDFDGDSLEFPGGGFLKLNNDAGRVFLSGKGRTISISTTDNDGNISVKVNADSDATVNCTNDTTFFEDGHKIDVKTITNSNNPEEKTRVITISSADESAADEEVESYTFEAKQADEPAGKQLTVTTPADTDLASLKDAGIKTNDRELHVENLRFSPNPSNGKFNLSFTLKEPKKVTINIYDINGQLVYTETLRNFQGTYNKEIDISDRGAGTFFLQIVQGLYDVIRKIIIR